ncbi:LEAF RUST 10 DISEASE-RESISTANCE LOCUS RECEPTOR-LIKE PROTEIN KINASE-like 2.7 [Thalictrum thalictroides]|uniref:LEAF RUST 10 DISEASE-RESISTANCE LOCUS RECEPTOR-LIKE PROTEIN KINASE-like 2.7 n=1 Tax=Thalictrum thalictroides TaxID=46969 RepID=A0A7J6WXC9_THATH|nr:LEAF RUST 10 DISEASE-RESISTANCE LOCUS RECEPTOR-LIKE PROTEIN KINASE-like 2.7 [Thalictrum thalictroides]
MRSYLSPAFYFFFIITIIGLSFCAEDSKYTACTRSFECGDMKNITYPFWGNGRPEYCGHPDFQLKCRKDNSVEIEIQSQSYRVLHINKLQQTLALNPLNYYGGDCPPFSNISLNMNTFSFNQNTTQILTLFYNCPTIPLLSTNFTCSINANTDGINYFWIANYLLPIPSPDFTKCKVSIVVPILQRLVDNFLRYNFIKDHGPTSSLEQVLKNGFELVYFTNVSVCNECESSGGRCGYDQVSSQPICFCRDGQNPRSCHTSPAATPPPQPSSSSCCSTQFQCGNLKGIGYPFWGNNRSSSCGKPEFELKCDQNNITQIQIMSNTYRVLSVLPQNQTIRIARMDLWDNICPSSPYDTPWNLSYSISSTRIFNLLYGCPVMNVTYPNLFTCADFNQTTDAYLLNNSMSSNQRTSFQLACQVEIQVPVLQMAFDRLMSGEEAIWQVFREGFDVLYDAENSKCNSCKRSGGECGYDSVTSKTVCASTNYVCADVAPGGPNRTQTSGPFNGGGEPVSSPSRSGGDEPVSRPSPSGGGEPVSSPSPSGGNVKVIVGIAASVGGTLVIAVVGIIIFCRLRKKKTKNSVNLEAFLKTHGALALRRYKYSDVRKMTDSFQDKLGQGGFGSVYKGKLLDGRMVAVKWIYKRLDLKEDLGLYGVTTIEEEEIARKMILVGLWCIQMDPSDRPSMSKVLEMLEGSLQALQIPPKPFISSPAREEGSSSTISIS